MTRRFAVRGVLALLFWCACTHAGAQEKATACAQAGAQEKAPQPCAAAPAEPAADGPASAAPQAHEEALYLDALQSIAEGRRNDASRELMRLVEKSPRHAGGLMDLALTQCALGHVEEAERLFAILETRFELSRALLELIAQTREQGCAHWQPARSWTLGVGRGAQQNVNQGASRATYRVDEPTGPVEHELSEDFRPHRDQYTQVTGEYTQEISTNGSIGFAQMVARRNDHLRQYDSDSLFVGVDSPWRLGRWTVHAGGSAGLVAMGGKLYQRQVQLQGRVTPPLPLPAPMQLNLVASVAYNSFLTLTNFNSNVWDLRSQLTWRKSGLYASASLGYLEDHALAQRPGGDRNGRYGNLLVRRLMADTLGGELAYTRQDWNSKLPYAPGVIEQVREQATDVLRATLSYAIAPRHSLQLEARVVHNRENVSIFQYNDRQLQLSWQWQGPGQ